MTVQMTFLVLDNSVLCFLRPLVSDHSHIPSKHVNEDVKHVWEINNRENSFNVYEDPRGDVLGCSPEVTIFTKEDVLEYWDEAKIKKS